MNELSKEKKFDFPIEAGIITALLGMIPMVLIETAEMFEWNSAREIYIFLIQAATMIFGGCLISVFSLVIFVPSMRGIIYVLEMFDLSPAIKSFTTLTIGVILVTISYLIYPLILSQALMHFDSSIVKHIVRSLPFVFVFIGYFLYRDIWNYFGLFPKK